MTLRLIFTMLFITLACAFVYGQETSTPDPQPGVARDLARFRAAHYSNVRYGLTVSVYPGEDLMKGSEEIHVTLDSALDQLVLDWRKAAPKDGQAQPSRGRLRVNRPDATDAREGNGHH